MGFVNKVGRAVSQLDRLYPPSIEHPRHLPRGRRLPGPASLARRSGRGRRRVDHQGIRPSVPAPTRSAQRRTRRSHTCAPQGGVRLQSSTFRSRITSGSSSLWILAMQSTEREDKGARQLLLSLWFVCHRSSRVTPPSTRSTQVPGPAGGGRPYVVEVSRTSVIVRVASFLNSRRVSNAPRR